MESQNVLATPPVSGPGEYPRVTPAAIESEIVRTHYFTAAEGVLGHGPDKLNPLPSDAPVSLELLTFCVLTLRNGFTVVGKSACADARNFDAEIGQRVAREDAVRQVWPLLGFLLRERLHELTLVGNVEDTLGEALTRMTAARLGNGEVFRSEDMDAILGHFTRGHAHQPQD
jgi:hypothetical protein